MAKRKTNKKKTEKQKEGKLEQVDFLQIQLNFREMEMYKKDLQTVGLTIENHEMAKQRAILQRNDIKNKIKLLESKHSMFLEKLEKEKGVSIKGKTIRESELNPGTYEIIDN